jgi:hypothetical protein
MRGFLLPANERLLDPLECVGAKLTPVAGRGALNDEDATPLALALKHLASHV